MITSILRLILLLGLLSGPALAETKFILLQSTTSTENSGLFDHILPIFEEETGIQVRVVAVGTGQALRNAANGDGDVLLVHAKAAEEQFVSDGHGVARYDVMYNDFVICGPSADPAGIRGLPGASLALKRVAAAEAPFVSRGDDSGTHKAEMRLWRGTGVRTEDASGSWYRETGSGMGATLNLAVAMGAYTLTDRATWLAFGNKAEHEVLVEGDPALFNQYGVIQVDPAKNPSGNAAEADRFVDWLRGPAGQAAIAGFRVDGEQLFFPNAE